MCKVMCKHNPILHNAEIYNENSVNNDSFSSILGSNSYSGTKFDGIDDIISDDGLSIASQESNQFDVPIVVFPMWNPVGHEMQGGFGTRNNFIDRYNYALALAVEMGGTTLLEGSALAINPNYRDAYLTRLSTAYVAFMIMTYDNQGELLVMLNDIRNAWNPIAMIPLPI